MIDLPRSSSGATAHGSRPETGEHDQRSAERLSGLCSTSFQSEDEVSSTRYLRNGNAIWNWCWCLLDYKLAVVSCRVCFGQTENLRSMSSLCIGICYCVREGWPCATSASLWCDGEVPIVMLKAPVSWTCWRTWVRVFLLSFLVWNRLALSEVFFLEFFTQLLGILLHYRLPLWIDSSISRNGKIIWLQGYCPSQPHLKVDLDSTVGWFNLCHMIIHTMWVHVWCMTDLWS